MKIFLSGMEGSPFITKYMVKKGLKMKYNLVSYYYIQKNQKQLELTDMIRDNSELILVDSGAHSFQFGKKVDWVEYTKKYAEFIKEFDRPNVLGYFEMDIENIIGYDKVLELRKILEKVTNKIIPVWHPTRGIDDYEKMCQQYAGKVIAIGGFRGTDIKDEQFLMFLKVAKKYNCKVHCLGMTRIKVLDKVPFDFTDSASWKMKAVYGRDMNNRKLPRVKGVEQEEQFIHNYILAMDMQKHYHRKWQKECQD